ncbi:MAG: acetate--CoA ligase family protein [Planctomycetes bacterium]|nr:acetate--CoA ligase family protein [Planctomycetota bacterium]
MNQRRLHSLDSLFRPRSVAVVGASREATSIGRRIIQNLLDFQFTGKVFPVNPKADVVHSMKCYPRVSAIPDAVDLAVIVVPRARVLEVVRDCGKKGVRALVVITAGFREVGGDGIALEEALVREVRRHGMRMVGPNCMGIASTAPDVRLNASFSAAIPEPGPIGFVSQSGALGEVILANARGLGLGVAAFVSMGNKADVSANDLLEYWEKDPRVGLILMYLESFGNPRKFTAIARRITRRKPILAVKAGRTAAGARAASSHTGSLVELDIAAESLLEQCGILRASSIREMMSLARAFATQPPLRGDRIAIVTNAGGPAILATDAAVSQGLKLADLTETTRRKLARILPPEATVGNPLDLIASTTPERLREALRLVAADRNVDGVIVIFVTVVSIDVFEIARAITSGVAGTRKPILSCFMGKHRTSEALAELAQKRIPVYAFPEEAAQALAAMNRYRALRERPAGEPVSFSVDRARAQRAVDRARRDGRTALTEEEVEDVLAGYGFPIAPSNIVRTAGEAIDASLALGYPVVLKAISKKLPHKSDVGGVKVDLRNADEVGRAFLDLKSRLAGTAPDLRVKVQKMVEGGREVIVGVSQDPQFGPLLLFGLGGVYVEVMRDVSVRIHPITDADAKEMVRSIRGLPILQGARGGHPVDLRAIEQALLRLSQLVSEIDGIAEMDVNPFIATERAKDCRVVDARIALVPVARRRQSSPR